MRTPLLLVLALLSAASLTAQPVDETGSLGAWTPDVSAAGALGALNAAVTVNLAGRHGCGGYVTTGTLSGTVTPEVTIDGTNWIATSVYTLAAGAAPTKAASVSLNSLFEIELPAGAKKARLRVSSYSSGTSTGTLVATTVPGTFVVVAGTGAVSGTVTANQGTAAATAGRWPVQPTDGTDLALVTAAGEQNVLATAQPGVDIGDVTINNAAGAAAVNVQDGGNSLTVDGSVTANAGTNLNTSALALDATITNRLPAGSTPADNESNAITTSRLGAFNYVFDGATWDRWTGAVSGTVTTTPPANASTNVAQFGGTNVSTGTGAGGAGIPRVTVSNDSTVTANAGTGTFATKEVRAGSSAITSVAQNAANVTCLASNANRLGATLYNDSVANVYVKLGATASSSSYTVKMFPDGFFTIPFGYTGIIDCIWTGAGPGNARITEVTS